MAYEARPKSGIGWMKKNETDNPKAPLLKGKVTVEGKDHWIAMFRSNKGPGFYSLSLESVVEQKRETYSRQQEEDKRTMAGDDFF